MPRLRISLICSVQVCPSLRADHTKTELMQRVFLINLRKFLQTLQIKHESTKFTSGFLLCQQLRLRQHTLRRVPCLPCRQGRAFFQTRRCSDQEALLCQHQVQQLDLCIIKVLDAVCPGETS